MTRASVPEFERRGASTDLVVLLHAYKLRAQSLIHVRDILARAYPDADILLPDLPFSTISTAQPSDVLTDLLLRIDRVWEEQSTRHSKAYERILFVGHSMGALYARKVYVCACGENPEAPFEPELKKCLARRGGRPLDTPRPWASHVDRIVLLAGMNRGWSISHHLSLTNAIVWSLGAAIGNILRVIKRRTPIIFAIRRGAPFITQLRIQWMEMRRQTTRGSKRMGNAATIQLLGSIDDMVSPEDNIDLVAGKDFIYLDVPESGHANVIEMDESEAGRKRRDVFEKAIRDDPSDLAADQVIPADSTLAARPDVTDVVFVIHGIRDQGYWTHKIARRVIFAGRKQGKVVASETSTYGYFPMLSFLWPSRRREKVEWLMDQYAEALATYPNAEFSYIGHSNGTYLLTRALQEYPSCRFKRVVFAGSVVQSKYDWSRFIPSQIQAVANYVATADWVVAYFPKALEILAVQDLGSAGHDGFQRGGAVPPVLQLGEFVVGQHSAALKEPIWDSIARFIISGELVAPPSHALADKQAWWVRYPAKVAPLIWIVILAILGWILTLLAELPLAEWQRTLVLAGYLGAIWIMLTRV